MGNQTISKTIRHNGSDYKVGEHGKIFFFTGLKWQLTSASFYDLPRIKAKLSKAGLL